MSQTIWSSIDPNTTSGTQLATLLNNFKDAVVSGFSGTSRPANLQAYGYWVDTTDALSGFISMMMYDGTSDIEMFKINTATSNIVLGSAEGTFSIVKISDDSIGPKIEMEKSRLSGGGQTLIDDIIGDWDFLGHDASDNPYVQARIRVVSTDDVTNSEQGAYISILTTPTDGSALTEVMRISPDGKIGFGIDTPDTTIHVKALDSTAGIKATIEEDSTSGANTIVNKRRSTGNGQVLNADYVGAYKFTSTDDSGNEIEVAKIEVKAIEDHTAANQGVELVISTKQTGSSSYDEAIKISNGGVEIFGESISDSSLNANMAHGGTTQDIFTIDGTVYGAFVAEIMATGRDGTASRQQKIVLSGVYDFNNTSWSYDWESSILGGSDKTIDLNISDAATLDVNYDCQLDQGTFVDGKLYVKIRRFPR